MMGTTEVLLHVCIVFHAVVECLEFWIPCVGLVSQVIGKINVLKQDEVSDTRFRASEVKSVIFEKFSENAKFLQTIENGGWPVYFACKANFEKINHLFFANSMELMDSRTLLRSFTNQ